MRPLSLKFTAGSTLAAALALVVAGAVFTPEPAHTQAQDPRAQAAPPEPDPSRTAIFAGGCFWCVEKDFDHVAGVLDTVSGYIGGRHPNPTYQTHTSNGDLEAVLVTYDPEVISFEDLTHTFLRTVDVTDDGGQFCDRGNSYRTAVFALSDEQRAIAEAQIAEGEQALGRSIVTRVLDASTFWPAENFHQDYYQKNPLRYQFYRTSCGRDRTVNRVWGDQAYEGVDKTS
ncbi:MAG: peptide-methionine (S)-S-oxide reductase MsrA [Devosiaceae bacterium]|nr:peptide-methionine (S)-S-oxide reductase MsrA [Devosiaceae bacterium MH13]